jgi:hypothetical protein
VQASGVGIMIFGMVGDVLMGEAGEGVQEERKIKNIRKKVSNLGISIFRCDNNLMSRIIYWMAC